MHIRRFALTIACLLAPLTQVACTVNPATGERSLTLMSWEQEKAMGLEAAPQFTEEFGGEVPDQTAQAYVDRIGAKLVAQIEPGVPALDWEFTLLDSDVINAFALPGGKVFLTRGLAVKLENEAEMAGVLGHEVGHVTARHANQRMSKQNLFNLGVTGLAVTVASADSNSDYRKYGEYAVPAVTVGGNLFMLKYGRDEESEADMLGMRYMSKAGYNPAAQRRVMEVLLEASGGGRGQPEWLATHPFPETRIERITQLLAERYPDYNSNPNYQLNAGDYQRNILGRMSASAEPSPEDVATISAALLRAHAACCAGAHEGGEE